jgi:hypothetical protein
LTGRHFFFPEIILCAVAISPFAAAFFYSLCYALKPRGLTRKRARRVLALAKFKGIWKL